MTPSAQVPANDEVADFDYVVLLAKLGAAGAEAFEAAEVQTEAA